MEDNGRRSDIDLGGWGLGFGENYGENYGEIGNTEYRFADVRGFAISSYRTKNT